MKKFFISAVMAIVALAANAQQQPVGSFSVMPRVGMGYTNISNMDRDVYYYDNGDKWRPESFNDFITYIAGVEGKYQINDIIGVSLGVDFNHYKTDHAAAAEGLGILNYNYDFSYSTLAIPVLAQFNIGNHFGVKCGIQPAFMLSAKENKDVSMKEFTKGTVWSIPVGLSWTFNSPLVLDLRYNIPISRVNKYDDAHNNKMSTVSLTLGYRIDL